MRSAENPRRMRPWPPFSRRDFLRAGAGAALSADPLAGVLSLAACQEDTRPASPAAKFAARYGEALRRAEAVGSPVAVTRVAAPAEVEVGPGQIAQRGENGGDETGRRVHAPTHAGISA